MKSMGLCLYIYYQKIKKSPIPQINVEAGGWSVYFQSEVWVAVAKKSKVDKRGSGMFSPQGNPDHPKQSNEDTKRIKNQWQDLNKVYAGKIQHGVGKPN